MNKFNVILLKLPTLYEILSEIKLELNFNLINFIEKNEQFSKYIDENPNALIISSELNGNYKNFISMKEVLKIRDLLQQINIFLSKNSYEDKSNILIGRYKLDRNSRTISNGKLFLKLTEREVDLLIYLNDTKKENSTLDLQKNVWKQSADLETHTVETHIYRLRKKINDTFNDRHFILNTKNGYKVLK